MPHVRQELPAERGRHLQPAKNPGALEPGVSAPVPEPFRDGHQKAAPALLPCR